MRLTELVPKFCLRTWFAFELSFAIAKAGAAHHMTVLSTAIPLFSNAVIIAIVMAPFCERKQCQKNRQRD